MRLSLKNKFTRKIIYCLLGVLAFALADEIIRVKNSAQSELVKERARLEKYLPFERTRLIPHLQREVQFWQNTSETRDFVKFQDFYFAATSGGLLQFSTDGKLIKHFTVLDGLSESDLTSLIVFNSKLFIGTRSKGLLVFDGENFESYRWTDRDAQAITAFLIDDGRLLIGTFAGGLIEFDGKNFREIKAEKERLIAVNCLVKEDSRLFVGTFAGGLWIFESGVWRHFTTAEGLPSNRVVGVVNNGENVFVATDFGLVQAANFQIPKPFRPIATLPTLSSLAKHGNQIFFSKANGEIFTLDAKFAVKETAKNKKLSDARFVETDGKLFLLSKQGIWQADKNNFKQFAQTENNLLTDNFVSALAFDNNENLWLGTFRNGIDVFTKDGKKLKHLESETIREINFLQSQNDTMFAATSSGLMRFKNDFSSDDLTKTDGLLSNSVTHFADADFLAIATGKGLTLNENGKQRSLSTVQGLPGNSIYTTLFVKKSLYVGTLGGLAEIRGNKVVRVFKDSNSNLKQNWVTALCFAGERLFIGTYGGGVFELTASGEIYSFPEIGKFVVNPNAMFSDGERLYLGTLEGVRVLDLNTQKWSVLKDDLPANVVMSITGDGENVYFGTTNGIARIEKSYFVSGDLR
ncbi:MAG: ligand-binding sensor domain-containing protein [Pyrinomonadaceae bacterium]